MCAVSMVTDYGQKQWWPNQVFPNPPVPFSPQRDADAMREFLKLVEAAKEFDAKTSQPHCEDPEKIKFLDAIEKRLAAIEEKLGLEPA